MENEEENLRRYNQKKFREKVNKLVDDLFKACSVDGESQLTSFNAGRSLGVMDVEVREQLFSELQKIFKGMVYRPIIVNAMSGVSMHSIQLTGLCEHVISIDRISSGEVDHRIDYIQANLLEFNPFKEVHSDHPEFMPTPVGFAASTVLFWSWPDDRAAGDGDAEVSLKVLKDFQEAGGQYLVSIHSPDTDINLCQATQKHIEDYFSLEKKIPIKHFGRFKSINDHVHIYKLKEKQDVTQI